LPKTATITSIARDAETTEFVGAAKITIRDPRSAASCPCRPTARARSGSATSGRQVPPLSRLEADGYLRGSVEVTVEPRHDVSTQIPVYKRPKTPNVVVTATEIKLKKEVHFLHGSAEILPDSMAILEEAADVLRSKPISRTSRSRGTPTTRARRSST
jgi:outer membrane protein OmpA-like peptidoglycan-associated protein